MLPFQEYQLAFGKHIREPATAPRPAGVSPRRMGIYNELLYNNLEGFLLACFPVGRKLLTDRQWARLMRAFFRDWRCQSPLFRYIPEEFVRYLQSGGPPSRELKLPPWFVHLAHYEWIELALDISNQQLDVAIEPDGDLIEQRPVLTPVHALLAYPYPVHRISADWQPVKEEATYILAFRDDDFHVRFTELNAVSARLVDLLTASPITGRMALLQLAEEMKHPDPAAIVKHGAGILQGLHEQGAIVGTAR